MNRKFKKIAPLLIITLLGIFSIGSYSIYKNEIGQIKTNINYQLINKSLNIKEYFQTSEALIYSLKYTIEDKLNIEAFESIKHPAFEAIKYDEKKNLYSVINFYGINSIDLSSVIGIGKPEELNTETIHEINSALHLKSIFNASMEIIPDLKWVYYTSKNNFIYMSPNYYFKDDRNLKEQYNNAFWKEAIPKNNPDGDLIITDLYKDGAGKGLMTTLSMPIQKNDSFQGVVSIDIGLNTLTHLLPEDILIGETYLIDEKNQIIASNNDFNLGDKISNKNSIFIPIVENEINLVHNIQNFEIRKEAFFNGIGKITILFLLLLITFIALYLKALLTKVQYFANTDSLTKLQNRRSMQREITSLVNISKRYKHELSFLLIDIDYFKRINDKYGHQTGDKVLIEIAKLFKRNTRKCDVVARYGGEEFLIALSNTNLENAYTLAERIRLYAQKIEIDNYNINFTISIGCTKLKEDDNFFSILKRVDKLLYKAKEKGRNYTEKEEEN
ncbi:sensor domain-containing diguanylate cyclase [Arcobacter sp. LA11]|uniref:sensor domain-containing diguanylate cyclase n=1 Tax=Arcobacter sp. LA11 TaxID=1898176 RepID=UPI00093342D5|nr:sensor domain-containing diguanylate cyclase [Arcobacter sp. LA11]